MKKQLFVVASCFFVLMLPELKAQEYEWEFDRMQRQEKQTKWKFDSTLVHLNSRWEIKLTYGRWFFSNDAKSNTEELFTLPGSMNLWQLMGSWHFSEKLSGDISIGLKYYNDAPTPDVNDVLNGNDIEMEGSGGIFLPIDLGLKYYLTKKRFRPLVGLSLGAVSANFRYIFVEGNINNGITTTETKISDRTGFGKAFAGFDYRLGQRTHLNLNLSYYSSGKFNSPIGGYSRYEGFLVNAGFSILL
jgi:outer membrane protein W